MARIENALRKLGAKCVPEGTTVAGKTIAAIINNIADNFDVDGEDGEDGNDGASVTAIALTTTDGAVTGGTATLSDGTTVNITVTEG